MLKNCIARLAFGFGAALMAFPTDATAQITVMISGGFFLAYQEVLPEFERDTGIAVTTLSGASQGTGPKTIRAQLDAVYTRMWSFSPGRGWTSLSRQAGS